MTSLLLSEQTEQKKVDLRGLADAFGMLREVADRRACVGQRELLRHLAGLFVDARLEL